MIRKRPSPPADADPHREVAALRREVERLTVELALARARAASLEALAHEDPLTGVSNRRGFGRDLDRALAYHARYGTPAAVILVDLDGFKGINDTLGHEAGDRALAHLAALLRRHVRASDSIGRLGGDEFALIAWHVEPEAALAKAAALETIAEATPLADAGALVPVRISAGVALLEAADTPESVLARADAAMYARKRARRAASEPGPG